MFSNITYTYRHTVRFGYPNITESVLRSHRSQLAIERTVQEILELQGLILFFRADPEPEKCLPP